MNSRFDIPKWMLFEKGGGGQPMVDPNVQYQNQLKLQQQQQQFDLQQQAAAQAAAQQEREWQAAQAQQSYQQQLQKEAQDKADLQAQQAADAAAKRSGFTNNLSSALAGAQAYGTSRAGQYGENNYGLMDLYQSAIDAAKGTIPDLADNISSYINPSALWTGAVNEATTKGRTALRNPFSTAFGTGYDTSDTGYADTLDDQYLNSILDTQKTAAQKVLDNAIARGTLNEAGKLAAQQGLSNASTKGMAQLQQIGGGVLSGYRNALTNSVNNLNTQIGNWQLGDPFDINQQIGNINNSVAQNKAKLGTDIANAVGDTQLFDIPTIIGKAGAQQGAYNQLGLGDLSGVGGTGTDSLTQALSGGTADSGKKKNTNTATGSGNTGNIGAI